MANKKRNGGSSAYAKPVTVGNGTLSYEMDATSTVKEVTVESVLNGIGLLPRIVKKTNGDALISTPSGSTISFTATGGASFDANAIYVVMKQDDYLAMIPDAVKIASVTAAPNAGTRLPVEINFYDGQLFRCDNAMKPTKVRPSSKTPAGLWHDTGDLAFKLFSVKGSNTANPIRVSVAVRQF